MVEVRYAGTYGHHLFARALKLLLLLALAWAMFWAGMLYAARQQPAVTMVVETDAEPPSATLSAAPSRPQPPASWQAVSQDGLSIQSLSIRRAGAAPADGRLRLSYQFALNNTGARYQGKLEMWVWGLRADGSAGVVEFPGAAGQMLAQSELDVRRYLQLSGELVLPDGFEPRVVWVRLAEPKGMRAADVAWL